MFIAVFRAKSDVAPLRVKHRAAHDEYWSSRMKYLWLAGPMLSDDQSDRLGQVLIVNTPDRAEAERLIGDDPYVANGVYQAYEIHRFRASVEKGVAA